jgi:hypothetical protein
MKFFAFSCFLVLLISSQTFGFSVDEHLRIKRSNETEGFSLNKLKEGAKSFGSKVSNAASKGFGEIKNLFSRDRKVGDYTLNNIDVRVREEEDYEEVGVKKTSGRSKREVENDERFVSELEEVMRDIGILDPTQSLFYFLKELKYNLMIYFFQNRFKEKTFKV